MTDWLCISYSHGNQYPSRHVRWEEWSVIFILLLKLVMGYISLTSIAMLGFPFLFYSARSVRYISRRIFEVMMPFRVSRSLWKICGSGAKIKDPSEDA